MDRFIKEARRAADVTMASLGIPQHQHSGLTGEGREDDVRDRLLRPLLPKRYGLGRGEVFAASGETSKQVDIVIYDDLFSPIFLGGGSAQAFPCESVFGTIEVKSTLNGRELKGAIENIRSVKRLPRQASTPGDVVPGGELSLGDGLAYTNEGPMNPYVGYILALRGLSAASATETMQTAKEHSKNDSELQELPDALFNLEERYAIWRAKPEGREGNFQGPGRPYTDFIPTQFVSPAEVLVALSLTLNLLLPSIRLKARNLNPLWARHIEDNSARRWLERSL